MTCKETTFFQEWLKINLVDNFTKKLQLSEYSRTSPSSPSSSVVSPVPLYYLASYSLSVGDISVVYQYGKVVKNFIFIAFGEKMDEFLI